MQSGMSAMPDAAIAGRPRRFPECGHRTDEQGHAMQRRAFLRVVGGGTIAAATGLGSGCSRALPDDAIAAWNGPGDEPDLRRSVLAHAILAPHSHNLQSWLVDLAVPDQITLRLDRSRLLPQTDPYSRQMLMSQGTFIELLDQAARDRGLRAEIALFPDGMFDAKSVDDRPVARVRLQPDPTVKPDPLFAQVFRRHTNREAYEARVPDPGALGTLLAASAAEGLRAGVTTSDERELMARQRQIAKEAWRIELTTPRAILESFAVLRIGPAEISRHRDGISLNDPMVRMLDAVGLFDRTRAPAPTDRATVAQIERFNASIDSTPCFYWLVSEGNDRLMQIRAGRAWVRAQLAATAAGLAMQPISQALQEYPELDAPYREIHALLQAEQPARTVQMWARLGHGPAVPPAPRRGLEAHLRKA